MSEFLSGLAIGLLFGWLARANGFAAISEYRKSREGGADRRKAFASALWTFVGGSKE